MDKEKFINSGLIELYVLGLASPAEQEIVMDYALAYPDIQETLNLSIEALEEYAKAHSALPPKDLRTKIMTDLEEAEDVKVRSDDSDHKKPGASYGFLASILGIGLLAFSVLSYMFFQEKENGAKQYKDLQEEYAQFIVSCETKDETYQAIMLENDFLKNKHTGVINLTGTKLSPQSKAIVFWNKNKQEGWMKIVELPTPLKGFQYQLWGDVNGKMVDLGTLEYQENTLIKVPFVATATSLNVSLEKAGGALQPTLDRLYISGNI